MKMLAKFLVLCLVCVSLVKSSNAQQRSAFDTDLYESVIDVAQCEQQLNFLYNHSLRYRYYDASARIPSGLGSGNINDLGDYHLCLSIDELLEDMSFRGKYCTITVPLDQNPIVVPEFPELPDLPDLNITWPEIPWPQSDGETEEAYMNYIRIMKYAGIISGVSDVVGPGGESRVVPLAISARLGMTLAACVPRVCPTRQAVDWFFDRLTFLNVTYNEFYCRLPDDKPLVAVDYVAISIFGLICLLVCASTTYDLVQLFVFKRDPLKISTLYRSFSIYTNIRRFLRFHSTPGALECVDGIRAISMMWVIVGHTHSLTLLGFVHNIYDIVDWITALPSVWVNSAPITVDTFFLLSGILCVYTVIGKISRARFIRSIPMFYLNRLLRMFPLLAAVILLQASLFHHVADGPFWVNVESAVEHCRNYWWSALLHIQNYVNPMEICLGQTWYLSVDVQLYLICPVALVFMFGAESLAWITLTAVILLSLVGSSLYSYLFNFSAALIPLARLDQFTDYMTIYYVNTLARAPPFFIGMAYGYLLHLWKGKTLKISAFHSTSLWALSFGMMAFCVFSIYPVTQLDHEAQAFDNFLNAYMRSIWALGLGWLVFACVQGYGGPINWFLSLRLWKLPARLSYAMYLIHFPIIYTSTGTWVKPHYFTQGETLYRFLSDLFLSFLAAFVLCIMIDAPFSTLQKIVLGGGKKRPQKPKQESQPVSIETDKYIKTEL